MNIFYKTLILIVASFCFLSFSYGDIENATVTEYKFKNEMTNDLTETFTLDNTLKSENQLNFNGEILRSSKNITITYQNKIIFENETELNPVAIKQAQMLGGTAVLFDTLVSNGENLRNIVNYLYPELFDKIDTVIKGYEKAAVNAKAFIKRDENGVSFSYTDEVRGKEADRYSLFKELFEKEEKTVELSITETEPRITRNELEKCSYFVSSAKTDYTNSPSGRKNNIAVASNSLFGKEIADGEIFSFNETVGERTKERGYEKAKTIVGGKYVEDYGGGVCQVATTIFNALLKAGLTIVESSNHSIAPSYVGISRDAMVSSFSDLKMKNDTGSPIFITGKADGKELLFEIYSSQKNREIKLSGIVTKVIKPPVSEYIYGTENKYGTQAGEEYVLEKSREGYICELYADIYEGDEFKIRKLLRKNYYPPAKGIIYVYQPLQTESGKETE